MKRTAAARRRRRFAVAVAALVAFSLFQFASTGAVRWPAQLYARAAEALADFTRGEDAGWRHAADAVEALGQAREGRPVANFDLVGRVVRVADGDTVSILDRDRRQHKVRLFGIDTPERDQPHGERSRAVLADLVSGRDVGVVIVERDDYGRTVGTLYLGETNVNLAMVAQGHAWWYRFFAPHEHALQNAESEARDRRLGLWRADDPVPPWDWRRGRR